MVDFVLHACGPQPVELAFLCGTVQIHPAYLDRSGAFHLGILVRDREAALIVGGLVFRGPDHLRIEQNHWFGRGILDAIHHDHPLHRAGLWRGKANAGGVIHGFQHVARKFGDLGSHRGHRVARFLQTRVGMDQDGADHVWYLRRSGDWCKRKRQGKLAADMARDHEKIFLIICIFLYKILNFSINQEPHSDSDIISGIPYLNGRARYRWTLILRLTASARTRSSGTRWRRFMAFRPAMASPCGSRIWSFGHQPVCKPRWKRCWPTAFTAITAMRPNIWTQSAGG